MYRTTVAAKHRATTPAGLGLKEAKVYHLTGFGFQRQVFGFKTVRFNFYLKNGNVQTYFKLILRTFVLQYETIIYKHVCNLI